MLSFRRPTQDDRQSSGKLDSMTNRMFDLSLVICTRNRATQLAQTLKSVSTIRSLLKWELIVVDNGSTDRTSDVVSEYAASGLVRCVRSQTSCLPPSRTKNRKR